MLNGDYEIKYNDPNTNFKGTDQPCLCVVECKHAGIICASNEVPDFEEGEELIFCASNEVLDFEEGEELIWYEELIW